jgi:ribose transport system permease protein
LLLDCPAITGRANLTWWFEFLGHSFLVTFLITGITGLSTLGISTFVQDLFYRSALVIAATLSQIVCAHQGRLA